MAKYLKKLHPISIDIGFGVSLFTLKSVIAVYGEESGRNSLEASLANKLCLFLQFFQIFLIFSFSLNSFYILVHQKYFVLH